jgi:hypothetical protein
MAKAIIAVVTEVKEIPNADKIQVAVVLGENVIVSKDVNVGYVGVFFPVETQLSEEYCKHNNLFRHSGFNNDNTKSGFFDDNRRVRAQPFLKVKSVGYFASLESLDYTDDAANDDFSKFDLGTTFDELNGHTICCKYISQATRDSIARQNRTKQVKIDYAPYFDKHVDSAQFKYNVGLIPKGALIHFHAKVHGTSHRSAHTLTNVQLPLVKRIINKVVPLFPTSKWDYVVGTRNIILQDKGKEGFHGSEQFRFDVAETLKPHLTKGVAVYGEIAGYANGKPIMGVHSSSATKDKKFMKKYGDNIIYKYGCAEHEYRFHIYRITYMNHECVNVDFTQAQLEQWCKDRGFLAPLNVAEPVLFDGDVDALVAKVEALTERPAANGEDYIDPSMPGEGIILRIDTGKHQPYFLKNKSYYFRCMESLCEAVDTEDCA